MNKYHRRHKKGKGPATGARGPDARQPPMKTAAWPRAPGKTRPDFPAKRIPKVKTRMFEDC